MLLLVGCFPLRCGWGVNVVGPHPGRLQLLSPGGDLLLSADRDEKIRVSQYPKAYNIEAYCLGHTQYCAPPPLRRA